MAVKTFYLTNASASVGSDLSETDPGTEAYRSPTTGWIVGTGSTNHSAYYNDVERASSTFADTTPPDGSLDTTNGDFWVSPAPLTGSFASGNWTIYFACRAQTVGGAQDGRARFRLFRGPNQDGSGATEITAAQQQGGLVSNLATSATQVSSATFDPGAITLDNEYLFVQIAWERTGAGGMTTSDVNVRIGNGSGTGSRVVTTDFTAGQNIEQTGSGVATVGGTAPFNYDIVPTVTGAVSSSGIAPFAKDLVVATRSTRAAYFRRGNSEYLSIAHQASLTPSGAFSMACWVYQIEDRNVDEVAGNDNQCFISKHDGNTIGNYYLVKRGAATGSGFEFNVAGLSANVLAPVGVSRAGSWHHVVCRYNGTNTLYITVDGVEYSQAVTGTPTGDTTQSFKIGSFAGHAWWADAFIDEVSYFNADIGTAGAENLWNNGVGKTYSQLTTAEKTNLVSWWALDEASGTRNDSHGTNHLTDNNTVESVAGAISGAAEAGGVMSAWGNASFNKDIVMGQSQGAYFITNPNQDFFTRAHTTDFDISNVDFSFSTWIKFPKKYIAGGYLVNWQGNNANERSWFLYYSPGNPRTTASPILRVYCGGASGDANLEIPVTDAHLATWMNFTMWYDSATNTLYAAINDGTPVSVVVPGGFAADSGTDYLQINGSGASAPYGAPDEWAIDATGFWRKKLSGAEVTELYAGGTGKHYNSLSAGLLTSLKAWWDFQETSGTRYDSSGNGYHLTDNNTVPSCVGVSGNMMSGGVLVSGAITPTLDLVRTGGEVRKSAAAYPNGYWVDAAHHFADDPFTWACWVKTHRESQNVDGAQYVTGFFGTVQSYAAENQEYGFAYGVAINSYRIQVRGPSPTYTLYYADVPCTSDWTLLVAKHVPADNKIYYSVNGGAWSSFDVPSGINYNAANRLSLNSQVGFNNTYHHMQGMGVWAKAIDDTELAQLYNSGKGCRWDQLPSSLKTSDCKIYLEGTEGSGGSIYDKSGNGFNANATNWTYDDRGNAASGSLHVWDHPGVLEIPAGAAITLTGTPAVGGDLTADVSGGAVAGGTLVPNIDLIRDPAGGAVSGGDGVFSKDIVASVSGGADTAGAGSFNFDLVWTGIGGGTSSGAGTVELSISLSGTGGGVSGGDGAIAKDITYTASGSASSTGTASLNWDIVFQTLPETDLRDGMLAWWDLDETTGVRYDAHTGDLDLTENGSVGSVAGPDGDNAASFAN